MILKSDRVSNSLYSVVGFIYFFTGLSALAYEVLWARILSTLFGVSIFGVVVTISAFLAGLGLGSITGKIILPRVNNPLRLFAFLEILVAFFAFNLPGMLVFVDDFLSGLSVDSITTWIFIQAVSTFILMFVPAFFLGLGFPLILATVNRRVNVGIIYALNTLGGVIGALLPLALLPFAGWTVSVRLVAIFALVMGLLALVISFFLVPDKNEKVSQPNENSPGTPLTLLFTYASIGAAAIMLEIAWTRLYGMVLLRTEYVMAVILATFLVGIGLGSLLAAKVKDRRWMVALPVLVGLSSLASLYTLPFVSQWAEKVEYSSLAEAMILQGGVVAILTLPATFAFGAWFPILVSLYKNEDQSSSLLYGFNSIGAALGGLTAGFLILPWLGTGSLIFIATCMVLAAGLYWVKNIAYKGLVFLFVLSAVPVLKLPSIDKLLPNSQQESQNLYFYEDAMSLTHVVERQNGERLLLADLQRLDASSDPTAVRVQKNQARLSVMLHPNPKSVLFLGLGTGITAAGTFPIKQLERTSVELSQGAIFAAENYFKEVNLDVSKFTHIIRDDARRFLKSTSGQFDVIVGDLFHPDLVGRSELLSLQQFERAKNRLNKDGVFVQWLALNQFDLSTLQVILSTFKSAFPDAMLFIDGFRIAMVGVNGDFYGIQSIKNNLTKLDSTMASELTGGEGIWSWAARYWGPIKHLPATPVQDEWAPVIEFQLPRAKFNRQNHLSNLLRYLMINREPLTDAKKSMRVIGADELNFEQAYAASEMYYQSWIAYFAGKQLESQQLLSMAYANNPDDQWIGFGMADAMFSSLDQASEQGMDNKSALLKILSIRPDHMSALKALRAQYIEEANEIEINALSSKIKGLSPFERLN